jgi:hypothetical protein
VLAPSTLIHVRRAWTSADFIAAAFVALLALALLTGLDAALFGVRSPVGRPASDCAEPFP